MQTAKWEFQKQPEPVEKRDSTLNFVYIALSLYRGYMDLKFLQEGTKVTTSYKGLQGVTKGYKGLYPSWLIMVKDQHAPVIDNGKIKIVCVFWPVEWCLFQLW